MRSKWLISVGLVVCLVLCFALPMCAPAPAPPVEEEALPEEELASSMNVWITTADNGPNEAEFIEKKLGISVKSIALSQGELVARLKVEAPRFSADFVMDTGWEGIRLVKDNNWAMPYDSPTWRGAGDVWVDPDNCWWNIGIWCSVLVGNKEKLDEAGYAFPESWEDLLDPKWKDEIVVPSALTSGNGLILLNTALTAYGLNVDGTEEGGWEYLEALDKNIHHYTKGGSGPIELVSRGEFMLGLGSPAATNMRLEEGYPLVFGIPKEGVGYGGVYYFIPQGTEELYTCQRIVDLFGTHEAGGLNAKFGFISKDPTVELQLFETYPKIVPNFSEDWAYENRERLLDEWKDKFLRG